MTLRLAMICHGTFETALLPTYDAKLFDSLLLGG